MILIWDMEWVKIIVQKNILRPISLWMFSFILRYHEIFWLAEILKIQ